MYLVDSHEPQRTDFPTNRVAGGGTKESAPPVPPVLVALLGSRRLAPVRAGPRRFAPGRPYKGKPIEGPQSPAGRRIMGRPVRAGSREPNSPKSSQMWWELELTKVPPPGPRVLRFVEGKVARRPISGFATPLGNP